jgi:hypothetical protein
MSMDAGRTPRVSRQKGKLLPALLMTTLAGIALPFYAQRNTAAPLPVSDPQNQIGWFAPGSRLGRTERILDLGDRQHGLPCLTPVRLGKTGLVLRLCDKADPAR